MTTPVLDVRGLAYVPGRPPGPFGVSLHVHAGERVALLGPNGAGKTTLILHLNGILRAGSGTVKISGLSVEKANLPEIRRRVGIVFQDPDDQLFMPRVREDVAFGPANLGLRGDALNDRAMAALEMVGMAEYADRPRTTSASASANAWRSLRCSRWSPRSSSLTSRPPTSTPHPGASSPTFVRALNVTLLMVTHDLPYALELCDRSVVLSDGVVVADGPTFDVLTDEASMKAHRLELPVGFNPRATRAGD